MDLAHDPKDTFMAILLSLARDPQQLDKLLKQNWVPEWTGWEELRAQASDDQCFALAQRFKAVAQANQPQGSKSNDARIAELQTQGLKLVIASPHGENNCLIDTLLLGMAHLRVLQIPTDIDSRQRICAACREFLKAAYGTPKGVFLDALIEAPRILEYFTTVRWQRSVYLKVRIYDRLDHDELGLAPEDDVNVFTFDGRKPQQPVDTHDVHIYCHTADEGHGNAYHFDLLWPCNTCNANVTSSRATKIVGNATASGSTVNTTSFATARLDTNTEPTGCSASSNQWRNVEHTSQQQDRLNNENGDLSETPLNQSISNAITASSNDKQELMLPVPVSHAAPPANSKHDHTVAPAAAQRTVGENELRSCLQKFLNSRSLAPIQVCKLDVASLRAKWSDMAEVGTQLQVWLGAGSPSFEPTRKNAHLLAKQWMHYYAAYTQAHERPHNATEPETNTKKKSSHRDTSQRVPACEEVEMPATAQKQGAADRPVNKRPPSAKSSPKQKAAKHKAAGEVTPPAARVDKKQVLPQTHDRDVAQRMNENLEGHRKPAPKRRYTKKAPQDPEDFVEDAAVLEQDEYWLTTWAREHGNPDPRAEKEAAIERLAALLRPQPALPYGIDASGPAFDLPN